MKTPICTQRRFRILEGGFFGGVLPAGPDKSEFLCMSGESISRIKQNCAYFSGMQWESAEGWISEYLESEHRLFISSSLKEHAEGILHHLFASAKGRGISGPNELTGKLLEAIFFENLLMLQFPAEVKRAIPEFCEGFFSFLKESGRHPPAGAWKMCAEAIRPRFKDRIRDDGLAKGETFRKAYTNVGRNDPCPCGSGQKFKKCCGPLIGL